MSLIRKKFLRDFDIFSWSIVSKPLCIQYLTKGASLYASDWSISFSWCGKISSVPPPWMSTVFPICFRHIALHSMCHPGLPFPQGLHPGASLHLVEVLP